MRGRFAALVGAVGFAVVGFAAVGASAQPTPTPTAKYRVEFIATWDETSHPLEFPAGLAHFSPLVGATHDAGAVFWAPGALASPGIENMAENGSTSPLDEEIAGAIGAGTADQQITGVGIASPDHTSVAFTATQGHPLLSLVTMVAPSPDWFLGVRDLPLFQGGDWVGQMTVDLFAYDAGTDSGPTFLSPNQDTQPRDPIELLTSGSLGNGVPLGRYEITRLATPVCELEVSQASYTFGETIEISSWRMRNPGAVPGPMEIKLFLTITDGLPLEIFNVGADGSIVLEPGGEIELGPALFATVDASFEGGSWELGCRLIDPVTGEETSFDAASFEIDL